MPATLMTATIYSKTYWTHTGIRVQKGKRYKLTATGEWIDKSFPYGPQGGPSPVWYLRLFEPFRRLPKAGWFTLCAALDEDTSTYFIIGKEYPDYVPPRDGEITAFANDVPGFYGNNIGSVQLTVNPLD